jgi:hypothetical protein
MQHYAAIDLLKQRRKLPNDIAAIRRALACFGGHLVGVVMWSRTGGSGALRSARPGNAQ